MKKEMFQIFLKNLLDSWVAGVAVGIFGVSWLLPGDWLIWLARVLCVAVVGVIGMQRQPLC